MIDLQEAHLLLALADVALVAGVNQVTAGTEPTEDWDPANGPAVVLNYQGGPAELEQSRLWRGQLSIRVYAATEAAAWDAYLLAHDALHNKNNETIISSLIATSGQLLPPEPDTRRRIILALADTLAREL